MDLRRWLFSACPRLCGAFLFWLLLSGIAFTQKSPTQPEPPKASEPGLVDVDIRPLNGQPWDFGVWAGGGFSVPGGTKDTHAMNAGIRLGKVLTDDHGSNFLRGNFEWSADLIPLYYIWQPAPALNAYGAAFNPVNLKWNFTKAERTVPYMELGGGVLFTNHVVPLNTSHVNFVTHAALGFQFFNTDYRAFTATVRYEHISNAGLTVPNPGINTVQFTLGMNWMWHGVADPKRK